MYFKRRVTVGMAFQKLELYLGNHATVGMPFEKLAQNLEKDAAVVITFEKLALYSENTRWRGPCPVGQFIDALSREFRLVCGYTHYYASTMARTPFTPPRSTNSALSWYLCSISIIIPSIYSLILRASIMSHPGHYWSLDAYASLFPKYGAVYGNDIAREVWNLRLLSWLVTLITTWTVQGSVPHSSLALDVTLHHETSGRFFYWLYAIFLRKCDPASGSVCYFATHHSEAVAVQCLYFEPSL